MDSLTSNFVPELLRVPISLLKPFAWTVAFGSRAHYSRARWKVSGSKGLIGGVSLEEGEGLKWWEH